MSKLAIPTPCVEILELRTKEYRAARELALHPKATWKHAQAADLALHAMLEAIDDVCDPSFEESPPLVTEVGIQQLEVAIEYLLAYANDLRDRGEAGNTEADDAADFVFAHIQQMCDEFSIVPDREV